MQILPFCLMALLLAVSQLAQAASAPLDVFLVIGQSNARGRGTAPPTLSSVPEGAYEWDGTNATVKPLAIPTGIPIASVCGSPCYWQSVADDGTGLSSPWLAFANTWYSKTHRPSLSVVRPKGNTGLTKQAEDVQQQQTGKRLGYWTQFSYTDSDPVQNRIYGNAMADLIAALGWVSQHSSNWTLHGVYVLWVQGENDVNAGVAQSTYQPSLLTLVNQIDSTLVAANQPRLSAFFLAETGYYFNSTVYPPPPGGMKTIRDNAQQIAMAQNQVQTYLTTDGRQKIVLASKSARYRMSPCINALPNQPLPVGCYAEVDLIHYSTPTYELIGSEMAANAVLFDAVGVMPLFDPQCKPAPAYCQPTVDIYRWYNGNQHVSGTLYSEFDANPSFTATAFKGVRYHLFTAGTGRVPLYRDYNPSTGVYMDSLSRTELAGSDSTQAKLLGYCYPNSTSNAQVPLMRFDLGTDHVTSQDQKEIDALKNCGPGCNPSVKTLCFTNGGV